ncbi:hypothetical protein [Streptomyces sp. MS2.AVA.5]|uniref:Uncharacterized protein n=1 Tax=Streptomyces achmelvichensis TaxID=3134111 RepID=A0ACC6PMF7_9ACTN
MQSGTVAAGLAHRQERATVPTCRHVNKKLANYLKCRQLLPGYENAPIGFRFTKSGMDTRFRAALEERFEQLRKDHPGLDLRLEITD